MKKIYKKIVMVLLVGIMLIPNFSYAKVRSMSSSRPKTSISTSKPKVSLSKPKTTSTLNSGTKPLKTISKSSTPKTTTKSNTNTSNSTTKKTIPKITLKKDTKNNASSTSKSNTTSKVYTVKKKSSSIKPASVNLSRYSTTPVYYSDNSFWKYYGIYHMINDKTTEKDIAEELAKKGYTESEINSILNDAKKENTKNAKQTKETNPTVVFFFVCAIAGCIGLICYILFRRK